MPQSPEHENVDNWYRALTNAEYDARHGHGGMDRVREVRRRYEAALNARDAVKVENR